MNTQTNVLMSGKLLDEQFGEKRTVQDLMDKGLTPVPEHLTMAARKALRNKERVTISKNSGGKLSNWAKDQRRQLNR